VRLQELHRTHSAAPVGNAPRHCSAQVSPSAGTYIGNDAAKHEGMSGERERTEGAATPAVLVAYSEGVTVIDLVGEHDLATCDEDH
jgi:hypothetical protein